MQIMMRLNIIYTAAKKEKLKRKPSSLTLCFFSLLNYRTFIELTGIEFQVFLSKKFTDRNYDNNDRWNKNKHLNN